MSQINTIKEKDVLRDCKQILEFLKTNKLLDYWRVSTGGVMHQGGKFMVPNREMIGFSDILILIPARVIFIETKSEVGKQTPAQKEFQLRVESMGHKYHLCRSGDELCRILVTYGVPANLCIR